MSASTRILGTAVECWLATRAASRGCKKPRVLFMVSGFHLGSAAGLRGLLVARDLRSRGWAADVVNHWPDVKARKRIVARYCPDVIVFQKARHEGHLPELYPSIPCVLDMDDADYVEERWHDRTVKCAKGCVGAIGGSRVVSRWLREHCPRVRTIWTCGPDRRERADHHIPGRPPTLSWVCSNPVKYAGELQFLIQVMQDVASTHQFSFMLVGARRATDCSELLSPLAKSGVACSTHRFTRNYHSLLRQVSRADIGLAPLHPDFFDFSAGKSFGKILVYLQAQLAVIASPTGDHPLFFENGVNGMLADSKQEWAKSLRTLLDSDRLRESMIAAASVDYDRRLSKSFAGKAMDAFLRACIKR